jgi:hypothetical protein
VRSSIRGGLLHTLQLLGRLLVGTLARLARAPRRVVSQAPCLGVGALLDLAGALLGGLHDLANLLRGRARHARRRGLQLSLELGDRVGELAQVKVDLLLVIAAPRNREILALDVVTIQIHASSRRRTAKERTGRQARSDALISNQTAEPPELSTPQRSASRSTR